MLTFLTFIRPLNGPCFFLFVCLAEAPLIFLPLTMIFICSLWQVFLNKVSIGFLDYKTTKITIPLTQVCYPRELGDG